MEAVSRTKNPASQSLAQAQTQGQIKSRARGKLTSQVIEESLAVATPAWPLQNTVAVNPFWFYRHQRFEEVLKSLSPIVHASLFMPTAHYLALYRKGTISAQGLAEAIRLANQQGAKVPLQIEEFLHEAEAQAQSGDVEGVKVETLSDFLDESKALSEFVTSEVSKYAAAYLDEKQAVVAFPWRSESFWKGWLAAQKYDRSMAKAGIRSFGEHLSALNRLEAAAAIETMLAEMGVDSPEAQTRYLKRLLASVLGWSTQFKYVEWQRQLGYPTRASVQSVDLLAVRLAYDFGIFREKSAGSSSSTIPASTSAKEASFEMSSWRDSLSSDTVNLREDRSFVLRYTLQLAHELSYQKTVAAQISSKTQARKRAVEAQMAFCIDVRSEMLRRNLEQVCPSVQTIGFAGFFGVPFDYQRADEEEAGHRLPVLLTPAFKVKETCESSHRHQELSEQVIADGFFRALRKYPLSSFVYVELFGAMYIAKMLRRTWHSLMNALRHDHVPERFRPEGKGPNQNGVTLGDGSLFSLTQKTDRAEVVLQHLGLTNGFAPLVMIVGHGSQTTNNALGSALDCGACGGHAGDINARFLADLLNDQQVRKGLAQRGIQIPETTRFVGAIHETVTDEIHLLDEEKLPASARVAAAKLVKEFPKASEMTRNERLEARSDVLDPNAHRRCLNWAEVRPEWGLAGNACFIVAPRTRTEGVNLGSRSFLHDYDWQQDGTRGFKTLELIMTAPMVVTNWINMQYYASTVAPQVYGSGNKVLHNLTNEVGVVEGNGGDLRVGLWLQSVHDGERFVHDPVRLNVFIEAPQAEIEKIVARHEVVRQLLDNGWLNFLHIEPGASTISRRLPGGIYASV
jgi:uncharacterized protein YbcC (UPF0753/DUF2309 family)